MSGVRLLSDSLFRQAMLFSLAVHLATLAWVQTPVWDRPSPPLVIEARLEPLAQTTAPPSPPSRATPAPTPELKPAPMPIPVPVSMPTPVQTPLPPPLPAPAVQVAPVSPRLAAVTPPTQAPSQSTPPSVSLAPTITALPDLVAKPTHVTDPEWYPARKLDAIPRRLGGKQPMYPESAQRRGVTGSVKVRLRVNTLGEVEAVEIISAQPEGVFNESVQKFFLAARYQPPQREGRPVRTVIEERIMFTLKDEF